VKEVRYLFTRFYFWCMVPGVKDQMEGCPVSETWNIILLIVTSFLVVLVLIISCAVASTWTKHFSKGKTSSGNKSVRIDDAECQKLQHELYHMTEEEKKARILARKDQREEIASDDESDTWHDL
jgi:hypothetical protein